MLSSTVLRCRQVVKEHMPEEAATVFEKCINEKALVLSGKVRQYTNTSYAYLYGVLSPGRLIFSR